MKIQRVIETVNQMQQAGVIESYAIGSAVAATFYLEPAATLDVDVFSKPRSAGRPKMQGEHGVRGRRWVDCIGRVVTRPSDREIASHYVLIAGWPVQFLPSTGALVEEALAEAVTINVEHTPARVFRAEHLAAIALQLGRAKDHARLLQFVESGLLDPERFQSILERHNLTGAWNKFESRFLSP